MDGAALLRVPALANPKFRRLLLLVAGIIDRGYLQWVWASRARAEGPGSPESSRRSASRNFALIADALEMSADQLLADAGYFQRPKPTLLGATRYPNVRVNGERRAEAVLAMAFMTR